MTTIAFCAGLCIGGFLGFVLAIKKSPSTAFYSPAEDGPKVPPGKIVPFHKD